MKRVLVTGATGFTARYAIPALEAAGFEVYRLSRNIPLHERAIAADITDPRGIEEAVARVRPTHVLHLAGTSNLPDSEAETLYKVNVAGTENLLAACAKLGEPPARILLPSSGYVYGDTGDDPAKEDRTLTPGGEYGKSKLAMERIAERSAESLSIAVVRPFNYTGVGHDERFLVPKLVRVFRDRGNDVSFVGANVKRDFSDVRWVARVYAALIEGPEMAMAINVCSGVSTALPQLVEMLEKLTGHRPAIAPRSGPGGALVGSPSRLRGILKRLSPIPLAVTLQWMMGQT